MRFRVQNAPYPTLHEYFFREVSRGLERKLSHNIWRHPYFQFLLTWRCILPQHYTTKNACGVGWATICTQSRIKIAWKIARKSHVQTRLSEQDSVTGYSSRKETRPSPSPNHLWENNRGQNCWDDRPFPPSPRVQCWDIELSVRWGDPTLNGGRGRHFIFLLHD